MDATTAREHFRGQREGRNVHFFIPMSVSYNFSTRPISELNRTRLNALRDDTPAQGSYLLLRTLEPPLTCSGIMLLVQDHAGDVGLCFLYDHVFLCSSEGSAEDQLPSGTVFVLKEPSLKSTTGQHGAIVVGSPSDFVSLSRKNIYLFEIPCHWDKTESSLHEKSCTDWRTVGNRLFKCARYLEATDAYLSGLDACDGDAREKLVLNLNLSATYLAAGHYEKAVKHASQVLRVEPQNEKALFRSGRAHFQLRKYKEAELIFRNLITAHPLNKDAGVELSRCQERLAEARGDVDVWALLKAASSGRSVDFGLYVGKVKVVPVPGKGRGVVAECNMAVGTLILVEKALASNMCDEENGTGIRALTTAVVRAFVRNPLTLGSQLYDLTSNDAERDKDGRIICDVDDDDKPIIDYCRFLDIVNSNSFSLDVKDDAVSSCSTKRGLFYFASFFNHSCLCNSTYEMYGDVIVVRLLTEVREGEEITVSYVSSQENFLGRESILSSYGFSCTCALCRLDRVEPKEVHEHRKELVAELAGLLPYCLGSAKNGREETYRNRLANLTSEMESTYTGRPLHCRSQLFRFYLLLAQTLEGEGEQQRTKFFAVVDRGLRSSGLSLDCLLDFADNRSLPKDALICRLLFRYASICTRTELSHGRHDQVDKWVRVLYMLERTFTGGDFRMLQHRFRNSELMTLVLGNAKH